MTPLEVLIATSNPHKVKELSSIVLDQRPQWRDKLRLVAPAEISAFAPPEVVEDGATYAENAFKKAAAFRDVFQRPVLADDSGIEVEALGGKPGLHSARFGGELSSAARNSLLIEKLAAVSRPWRARFRCVLCFWDVAGEPQYFEGVADGEILPSAQGVEGFGYDPVFFSFDLKKSFSQASDREKNRVSHRGRAVEEWLKFMSVSHVPSLDRLWAVE